MIRLAIFKIKMFFKGPYYVPVPSNLKYRIGISLWHILTLIRAPAIAVGILLEQGIKPRKNRKIAILLGNGPSVTAEISSALLDQRGAFDLYTINYYNRNSFSSNLIPDYHLISDPKNFDFESNEKKCSNIMLYKYLVNNQIKTYVPYAFKQSRFQQKIYYNDDESFLITSNSRYLPRYVAANSMAKILRLVIGLEYEQIYVIGFDYNYLQKLSVGKSNNLVLNDEHSYGTIESDWNEHFLNYRHALEWFARDFNSFAKMKKFNVNVTIVSDVSVIDWWPRLSEADFLSVKLEC